ncbi:probable G-protein coupled receptor 148 [Acanthochromis polyacanthus]|uniref:probable G-protein coupled receptor 148 n=1 Tax=Acanthochromis polyacanthus TaxID=80966 RepID=UPI000B8FFD7A|nr:probable G-protein coupled receptor 148 [Acanthochromis polyacanthus]
MPSTTMFNLTKTWFESLHNLHLEFLIIPAVVITLATLIANPVLLTCIFLSRALRQETRYLLVANTLMADMLFLIFNLITVICNTMRAQIPWRVCELITAVSVTAYCCAILTVTLMVVDTYTAVRWPLQYHDILPPARTRRILVGMWVLSAVYPFVVLIMMEIHRSNSQEKVCVCLALISFSFLQIKDPLWIHVFYFVAAFICATMICYCYIRLYMVTRTQGIWQSRFSRARVTLLAHAVLLLLYFAPGFVFIVELSLFNMKDKSQDLRVWVNTANICVFMLLPRALAPYLYGLRYREISDTLMMLVQRNNRPSQNTVS